jgi:hypothetical protein
MAHGLSLRIRQALEPFREAVEEMVDKLRDLDDEQLALLSTSHNAVTKTNCAWSEWRAAHWIHEFALRELAYRQRERQHRESSHG